VRSVQKETKRFSVRSKDSYFMPLPNFMIYRLIAN